MPDINTILAWLGAFSVVFVILERANKIYQSVRGGEAGRRKGDIEYATGLQGIADRAVDDLQEALVRMDAQKVDYDKKLADQKDHYDRKFSEQDEKIKQIMEKDLKIELIVGGYPQQAKSIKLTPVPANVE